MASGTDVEKLTIELREAVAEGGKIGEMIERGQGETPLSDRYGQMWRRFEGSTFNLTLVTLDDRSVLDFFRCVCDAPLSEEWLSLLPDKAHLVEIRFGPGKHSLETNGERWEEFHSEKDLIARTKELLNTRAMHEFLAQRPLKITYPMGTLVESGAGILYVPNPNKILDDPALLGAFAGWSGMAAIAGPAESRMTEAHQALLSEAASNLDIIWPVILLAAPVQNGWWKRLGPLGSAIIADPVFIEQNSQPLRPPFLNDPADPLRLTLMARNLTRDFRSTSQAFFQRCDREGKQLEKKSSLLKKRSEEILVEQKSMEIRSVMDKIRVNLEDDLAGLTEAIDQHNRLALSPNGPVMAALANMLEELDELEEGETTPKAIKLEVPDYFVSRLRSMIHEAVDTQFRDDMSIVRSEIENAELELRKTIAEHVVNKSLPKLPRFDEERLRSVINAMISVDIRTKGEIPKQGIMKVISGGRQKAFMLIISLNLVLGGLLAKGTNIKTALGAGVAVLFIGGIIGSVLAIRKDRQELKLKELERVKEAVTNDARRLFSDSQREIQNRVSNYCNDLKKKALREADEILKAHMSEKLSESEEERLSLQARIENLAGQSNQIEEHLKAVSKLEKLSAALDGSSLSALKQAAMSLQAGATIAEDDEAASEAPASDGVQGSTPAVEEDRKKEVEAEQETEPTVEAKPETEDKSSGPKKPAKPITAVKRPAASSTGRAVSLRDRLNAKSKAKK
jgi:hypothetical protein